MSVGKLSFVSFCDTRGGYWREKCKLERKLFETEKASKLWHVNKFCIIFTTPGFSQPIYNSKEMMFEAKILAILVSRNILIFTWLKLQEILETLESQVWWIWMILTENDS